MAALGTVAAVRTHLARVVDPEIPVLTIADIGILRDVSIDSDGTVRVFITPTYSGCPALDTIRADIERELLEGGYRAVEVQIVHQPAWTTDWMSPTAKKRLADFGIAPPGAADEAREVHCPRCSSGSTKIVSEFGSTACKALMVCGECHEPFDLFKAI